MWWLGFVIGLVVGTYLGALLLALMIAGSGRAPYPRGRYDDESAPRV